MTKSIELLDDVRDLYNGLLDGLDPCLTSNEGEVLKKIDTKFNELESEIQTTDGNANLIKNFIGDLNDLLETDYIYDILLNKKEKWKEKLEE
jgi:hydrogenase maturation factor